VSSTAPPPATRPSPRPRFALRSPLEAAELRQRVNAHLKSSPRLRGIAFDHRLELAIDGDEHHFWSPQLVVQVTPRAGGGLDLDARFGPDPYVWAMYLLAYGTLLVLTFFAAMFGIAQWTLGQQPVALFVAPAAGVMAGLVYGASFVGQGLGSEQMYFLRATLTTLAEAEDTSLAG
jgi:hypothetical protein